MIIKLTGPREGQTVKLGNVQFIDGYAEVPVLSKLLEKYYGVVEDGLQNKEVQEAEEEVTLAEKEQDVLKESLTESVDTGSEEPIVTEQEVQMKEQELLQEIVKAKKEELEKKVDAPKYKTQADFPNFFQYKAYVREVSGITPKNKKHAAEIMKGLN